MTYALEQITWWKILYDFWVCWLLKVDVVVTWLQHRVLPFPKHGIHFPGFKVLLFIFFTMLPMNSLRFFLHLKAVTGSFSKIAFRYSLMDSMFQFFRITLLMFGKMRVLIGLCFLLPFVSSFLSSSTTCPIALSYTPVQGIVASCSKSCDVVKIRFILSAWLYGILSFNDFGCSESLSKKLFRLVCFLHILVQSLLFLIYTSVSRKEILIFEILYSNLIQSSFVFNSSIWE